MNEVRALVEAFDAASARGQQCALATIVSVEGSSYRRPGARMLVCEDGTSTGTISAGCLESDVIEHARRVMRKSVVKLVEYNTASTSDEMAWGLGLGCNGIVRILVEPLAPGSLYIEALRRSCEAQSEAVISVATVYQASLDRDSKSIEVGARIVINEARDTHHEKLNDEFAALIESGMRALAPDGVLETAHTCSTDVGGAKVFMETLLPPVPLTIFGAGHDVLPVVELAHSLGWQTEVVDPQARPASYLRFAVADKVTLARPAEVEAHVSITPRTMAILMSHNYTHDMELLKFLLASPARYIGIMGPRKRTERMLEELLGNDELPDFDETKLARIYSPAGLDIGANGPAEIALSILAEMRAVLDGRGGGMLRERRGPIHGNVDEGEHVSSSEERILSVAIA